MPSGNETLRQTPFYQPGPQIADRRRQATIATGSPPIDAERRKPRNLEPNLRDVPAEIVRSAQSGAKLLKQAFAPARAFSGLAVPLLADGPGTVAQLQQG